MAATKRVQVLMEPEEFGRLETLARQRGLAVAELIRRAVRQRYFCAPEDGRKIVEELCAMNLPVGDWDEIKKEIVDAHTAGLP